MRLPLTDDETRLWELVVRFLRDPSEAYHDTDLGDAVFTFDPPMDAAEQARFDRLRSLSRSAVQITPAEWEALLPRLVSIRSHRTRTNAEWQALTAAQRDASLIDWCRDLTDVLRALLRD